jgi:hypothetical protein
MPSVVVSWRGTCVDADSQEELITFLTAMALESRERFARPAPKRPVYLEQLIERESKGLPDGPAIIEYDGPINGNIVVDPFVTAEPLLAPDELTRLNVPWVSAGESAGGAYFFSPQTVHLRGIDFRLFDPREIYPLQDRLNFVFLRCTEVPAINGKIAQVVDHKWAQIYYNETIRAADWFVAVPGIHLRYYLEEWIDQFFAWIKYFFIPDLTYWRHDDLPGYDEASALFDEMISKDTREQSKLKAFLLLMEWFQRDADDLTAQMATW